MTEAKHTPGPWRTDPRAEWRIVGRHDDTVATAGHQSNIQSEWGPNGRLIAAAPDMLAELRRLYEIHGYQSTFDVIAKAEGRT